MKAMKALFWLSVVMAVLSGALIVAMPLGLEKYLRHNGWALSSTWLTYGAVVCIQLIFGGILAVMAFQSIQKSRVIQDQRFFVESTHGIDEMVRQTYARFGAEEGVARKEVAELALEGETMDGALQAIPGAQARIVRRLRYAAIAASLDIKIATN